MTLDEDILIPYIKMGVITNKFVDETVNIMMKFWAVLVLTRNSHSEEVML